MLSAENFGPFLSDRSRHFDFDFLKRLDKIRNIVKQYFPVHNN